MTYIHVMAAFAIAIVFAYLATPIMAYVAKKLI